MTVRVAVAEDNYILREGLERVLASCEDIELVASCADLGTLSDAVREHDPDVVLTDIRMPPSNTDDGIRFASDLRRARPATGVIVLSQYLEPAYVLALFASGSSRRGYLLKERVHERSELVGAIMAVAHGGSVIDPKVIEVLVEARRHSDNSPLAELTLREMEVLQAIAQGKSNVAIADELVLTKHAVEKHINVIFSKLGLTAPASQSVSRRVMAALMFLADAEVRPGEV